MSINQLNNDENRLIGYYRRLNTENKDYIKGFTIKLIKEQAQQAGNVVGHTKRMAM